jgi:hypothetical protein
MQELWFGPAGWILGGWTCRVCHTQHGKPTIEGAITCPESCRGCGASGGFREEFRYDEIRLENDVLGIRGFTDALARIAPRPAELWDIKSTGSLRYVKKEPRVNDVKQLYLYLDMAGMKRGRLIYVDRTAKKFVDGIVEHEVVLDEVAVRKMKETVREFREALSKDKSEQSLPTCPNGGVGSYGPCQCKGLDRAWASHGPGSGASAHGHLHPEREGASA